MKIKCNLKRYQKISIDFCRIPNYLLFFSKYLLTLFFFVEKRVTLLSHIYKMSNIRAGIESHICNTKRQNKNDN